MEVNRPLAGLRIAITRPLDQTEDVVARIHAAGGEARLYPLIDIALRHQSADFLQAIAIVPDLFVFTSVNGVRAYVAGCTELGHMVPKNQPAYCVGSATAKAAQAAGFAVQAMPQVFAAENLPTVIHAPQKSRTRILLVRGNLAEPLLPLRLEQAGYEVSEAIGYETTTSSAARHLFVDAQRQQVDVITFYSGSAVTALLTGQVTKLPSTCVLAAVGPKTAQVIKDFGYEAQVVATSASTEALIEALIQWRLA